ncbi:MAG TPA: rhodanese-like domain-containing protein [Acetobacteraceae bacterium]|nr:rhodanese-like domain-containing protein [Acetobacteraceae bacterium]
MIQNVSVGAAWAALTGDPDAQLVDCRTDAEWQYVGIPDLRPAGKQAVLVSWQYFPSGNVNPAFVAELRDAGLEPRHRIYFLCRSGVRSYEAARAARAEGYAEVFNISDGFEGPHDVHGHRGLVAGWKAAGLPWRQ